MGLTFARPLALLALLALPLLALVALRGVERGLRGRRVAATAVRAALLALLVLALAGPALVRRSDHLAVIYLVDASDSVGPDGVARAHDFIKASLATMPRGDAAGIVVFGENALVERSVSADPDLAPFLSRPATGHTDLAGAVRLGLALFPEGYAHRLVLLTDGQENEGNLETAAASAAASGAEIATVTLASATGDDALVSEVQAPATAREGESLDVRVTVESTVAQAGRLRLFMDNGLLSEQQVQLRAGQNSFVVTVPRAAAGFHTFRAEVAAPRDARWQNDTASAFTDVRGRPRVLVLEGQPGEGENLAAALTASGFVVERTTADRAPADLPQYVNYDAVALVDVPADALGARMATLQSYVRDLGRGLIVVGGERAYGPGGYAGTPLEETLPVRMETRQGLTNPPVSIVFVIDKSGSMGEAGAPGGAISKMDLAKEAVYRAIKLVQPQDRVGVVAFDTAAQWVARLAPLRDQPDIADRLGSLRAGGGTDIYAGLDEAVKAQLASPGKVRHIILVTDGQSPNQFDALLRQMRDNNITLSVIGVGQDVASYLPALAAAGGGRYYFAADPSQLPEIFLQETQIALRSYLVEGDIALQAGAASPITAGIAAYPHLLGYVATTAKPAAATPLASDQGDPLLAQWQYGLGRVVAWTSDAKGQWAANWLSWPDFARFWGAAAGWTIAAPPEALQLHPALDGDRATLTVDALDPAGNYRNGLAVTATVVAPDGTRREVPLRQSAPGRYTADLGALAEGAHLLAVVARDAAGAPQAAATGGLVVPYSPEYALPRGDQAALARARDLTGGRDLTDPAQAFAHTLPPAHQLRDVWPPLL
ncbi:MAG TPA: VWA domain-containing protein, partial [Thermomicrobiales bacterium]|nr:VWA domain-containing protein [Thermomicrobiales bacterium]